MIVITPYRATFLIGSVISMLSFLLVGLFYRKEPFLHCNKIEQSGCRIVWRIVSDSKFWRFLFLSFINMGTKILSSMLPLLLPPIVIGELGS